MYRNIYHSVSYGYCLTDCCFKCHAISDDRMLYIYFTNYTIALKNSPAQKVKQKQKMKQKTMNNQRIVSFAHVKYATADPTKARTLQTQYLPSKRPSTTPRPLPPAPAVYPRRRAAAAAGAAAGRLRSAPTPARPAAVAAAAARPTAGGAAGAAGRRLAGRPAAEVRRQSRPAEGEPAPAEAEAEAAGTRPAAVEDITQRTTHGAQDTTRHRHTHGTGSHLARI